MAGKPVGHPEEADTKAAHDGYCPNSVLAPLKIECCGGQGQENMARRCAPQAIYGGTPFGVESGHSPQRRRER